MNEEQVSEKDTENTHFTVTYSVLVEANNLNCTTLLSLAKPCLIPSLPLTLPLTYLWLWLITEDMTILR